MQTPPSPRSSAPAAFTLMEILVAVTIILVLAVIAIPAYRMVMARTRQTTALNAMRQISAGLQTYISQNDGAFPAEDAKGVDAWSSAALPENASVWYNALPRLVGAKGVADYANNPRGYYSKENLLFLPGAEYPPTDHKFSRPLFAIAINTKLQRKNAQGVKLPVRMGTISNPARTVGFLEQGLPNEQKAMAQQPKYDGSCKGSAKSFVARYTGRGVLTFLDGHAETVLGSTILNQVGAFPYPQTDIVWTHTPEEDPNK